MRIKINPQSHDNQFRQEVEEKSGVPLTHCLQCSKCGGACSICADVDISPRQVVEYVLDGVKEKVFDSRTIWGCGNCDECFIECPSALDINHLMKVLRELALAEGWQPNLKPIDRI